MNTRRHFIRNTTLVSLSLLVASRANADLPMVGETDANAQQLGYVADAAKANKSKFPSYQAGQKCSGCQLYQGKSGSTAGPCTLFAGKQVAAGGWCSAFAKKA